MTAYVNHTVPCIGTNRTHLNLGPGVMEPNLGPLTRAQ